MAMKGLGKGLGALLSKSEEEYDIKGLKVEENNEKSSAVELPITQIFPNVNQPRKVFDEVALNELANSIRVHGVISPIIVVKQDNGYMIIAGERRWRASRMAGLSQVPVVVKEMTDEEAMELALIENLQREDLNPVEEALGYRSLAEEYDMTQEELSKQGKSHKEFLETIKKQIN